MIIDRIENKIVICEDDNGEIFELPIDMFVEPIHDGDVVIKSQNGVYQVDTEKTRKKLENAEKRFNNLFK